MANAKILPFQMLRRHTMRKEGARATKTERSRKANTVQVSLTDDEKKTLHKHCIDKEITMADWIAEAIRTCLRKEK